MKYTEKQLENLRQSVKSVLSEKRYRHTLGVERAAFSLAEFFPEIDASELCAAALLHDITKEITDGEHLEIMGAHRELFTDSDMECPSVYHSFTAPFAVVRGYPEFATENILSSLKNHTTGAADMSLFDELIFISDYVEDGRTYESCTSVRSMLFLEISSANSADSRIIALHRACLASIENTLISVLKQGRNVNKRTFDTREYLLRKINGE